MKAQQKFIFLVVFGFLSCSNKYKVFESKYTFKSDNGRPAYELLDYWAAHPVKWDPSDSIPQPLRNEPRDTLADVFFIHPTTFTAKKDEDIPTAAIDDNKLNAKTDYSTILYQASVFNQHCRVFAPRYRQAHIRNFFSEDKNKAAVAFEIAYEDVKTAFIYYLNNWNTGRPIIIAGHSQGAFLAERLLQEFFEGKELKKKLVAAYILGWPVPRDYYTSLKMCEDSLQTSCLVSWRTFRHGYLPSYLRKANHADNLFRQSDAYVTNPLSWTITNEKANKKLNKGSVLTRFNKVYKNTCSATIGNSVLYVNKPKFPWGFLYFTKNYHIADINLFYINIKENVAQRIRSFLQ